MFVSEKMTRDPVTIGPGESLPCTRGGDIALTIKWMPHQNQSGE